MQNDLLEILKCLQKRVRYSELGNKTKFDARGINFTVVVIGLNRRRRSIYVYICVLLCIMCMLCVMCKLYIYVF